MGRQFKVIACAIIWSCLSANGSMAQVIKPSADLVFRRGAVYTVDAARTWAESVAVTDGRITYVGPDNGVEAHIGPKTRVVDLEGKMLLPGFHDSHVHPVWGGVEIGQCSLHDLSTQKEIYDKIVSFAASHPRLPWITGAGWSLPVFPGAAPTSAELDKLVSDRPVYLESQDCHSAWVNSRALQLAGISKDTADPAHGHIERDPATGEPSGTLRESAMELVEKHLPKEDDKTMHDGLVRAQELASGFGITSLQDADADEKALAAYVELDKAGKLNMRVVASLHIDPHKDESQVDDLIKQRDTFKSPRVRPTSVKIFEDGVIEAHTAALLEPYLDRKDFRGDLNFEPEALNRLIARLDKAGFQVHVHAIGDRAVRATLDAHEAAQKANGKRDARHHIAHLQVVSPEDWNRFRQLGIVANFQSYWCQPDQYITKFTEPVLGPERSRHLYPVGTIARTGAIIAGGSDWPVSSMNPLDAIQVAVTRRAVDDDKGPAWLAEERVDLATMLAAYTINGAFVNHQEKETGSIETGKFADLIVLEHNLFAIPPDEIHKTRVLATYVEGKEVHRHREFAAKN